MAKDDDLLAFLDPKLEADFNRKEYDPTADRERWAKRVDATRERFTDPEPKRGRKGFSVQNGVALFQSDLMIGDREVNYIPVERFEEFLTALASNVRSGSFDAQMKKMAEAALTSGGAQEDDRPVRKPRKPREGGGNGWSPERRAKYEETLRARREAKVGA